MNRIGIGAQNPDFLAIDGLFKFYGVLKLARVKGKLLLAPEAIVLPLGPQFR